MIFLAHPWLLLLITAAGFALNLLCRRLKETP